MPSLAGKFLIARSMLQDPNFRQTVILLLQHGTQGAFGLVVNRPTKAKGLPFSIFSGGPCGSEVVMLHGHVEWVEQTLDGPSSDVATGIYIGDANCLGRISDPPDGVSFRFRMFTGYSGWGPDQLESELAAGAWAVAPANGELLFDTPVDELWDQLSPPAIPQPSLN